MVETLKQEHYMSNYTFTVASSYALSTHEVSFTDTTLIIKLSSTGQTVYSKAFDGGLAFMCQSDDFCVGTLSDNGVFTNTVDMSGKSAVLKLIEATGQNKFIGSDNEGDPSIAHKYNLNQCPVRLVQGSGADVELECPCENATGTCSNTCYTYG